MGATCDASGLLAAVRAAAARHRLIRRGDRVVVAVSGGADSVALLHALTRLRDEDDLTLLVCHVHHGLRPEADQDAAFVRDLAARLGCRVTVERVGVAHRPGRSPEAAARVARYAALDRVARGAGAARIAVGHTADDQAETVLMHFLQGAGPRGLAGMPVRRGRLVRPLLGVGRPAVLAYLAAEGLAWVEDATNHDPKMLRNRIRHEILPLLEAHGWPRIRRALGRTARGAREAVEALDQLLAPRAAALSRPAPGGLVVDLARLDGLPVGAVKTLLGRAVGAIAGEAGARVGLRAAHLDRLAELAAARAGARVRLPDGLAAERARDAIWIGTVRAPAAPVPLVVPGVTVPARPGLRLEAAVGPRGDAAPPASPGEAWFDAADLAPTLEIRSTRMGDRMMPFGGTRAVRVARLLAGAGAARGARRQWPLLVARDGERETVMWVVGVRRGAAAPVTSKTEAVLRVRVAPEPRDPSREEST